MMADRLLGQGVYSHIEYKEPATLKLLVTDSLALQLPTSELARRPLSGATLNLPGSGDIVADWWMRSIKNSKYYQCGLYRSGTELRRWQQVKLEPKKQSCYLHCNLRSGKL